jgi:hypothetical protein
MAYRMHIWRENNPEKRALLKRRDKVRRKLRDYGILSPVGSSMTQSEQEIYDQIGRDDYSFWDMCKLNGGPGKLHNGGIRVNQQPKAPRTKEYLLWDRVRQSCKEKDNYFDLKIEDITIPLICPITGIEISTNFDDRYNNNYFVLDRIDWEQGFISGNVRVVSLLGLRQRALELSQKGMINSSDRVPSNIKKFLLNKARHSAIKNKYECNLTIDDIEIPKFCPYLNIELSFNKKNNKDPNYASIDRIDSSKEYIKGNVMIISRLANTMKNNATIDQMKTFSKNVLKIYNSKKNSKKFFSDISPA